MAAVCGAARAASVIAAAAGARCAEKGHADATPRQLSSAPLRSSGVQPLFAAPRSVHHRPAAQRREASSVQERPPAAEACSGNDCLPLLAKEELRRSPVESALSAVDDLAKLAVQQWPRLDWTPRLGWNLFPGGVVQEVEGGETTTTTLPVPVEAEPIPLGPRSAWPRVSTPSKSVPAGEFAARCAWPRATASSAVATPLAAREPAQAALAFPLASAEAPVARCSWPRQASAATAAPAVAASRSDSLSADESASAPSASRCAWPRARSTPSPVGGMEADLTSVPMGPRCAWPRSANRVPALSAKSS